VFPWLFFFPPHIGFEGFHPADSFELFFLDGPQHLHLKGGTHISDFVEEEGSPLGQLESAGPAADGAREGALFMTEQFTLQKIFRDRAAINGNQWVVPAGAVEMDRLGHQFLARAALAVNQNGTVRVGDLLDRTEHFLHAVAVTQQLSQIVLLLQVVPEMDILCFKLGIGYGTLDGDFNQVVLEGFGNKVESAQFHRLHGVTDGAVSGDDDYHVIGIHLLREAQ